MGTRYHQVGIFPARSTLRDLTFPVTQLEECRQAGEAKERRLSQVRLYRFEAQDHHTVAKKLQEGATMDSSCFLDWQIVQ